MIAAAYRRAPEPSAARVGAMQNLRRVDRDRVHRAPAIPLSRDRAADGHLPSFCWDPRYFVKIGPGVIFAEEDYFELTKDRRIDGNQTLAIGTQAYRVEYHCTYSEGDYCLRSVDMDLTLRPVITWIGPTHIPQGSSIAYSTPVEEH